MLVETRYVDNLFVKKLFLIEIIFKLHKHF